jgi:colanic acid biosynthesis glycosyl transferase WcaI
MTKLRTLLVCQWFPPEPVYVPLSIAQELQARGHRIHVLTGIPTTPTAESPEGTDLGRHIQNRARAWLSIGRRCIPVTTTPPSVG